MTNTKTAEEIAREAALEVGKRLAMDSVHIPAIAAIALPVILSAIQSAGESDREFVEIGKRWKENSALENWFPITAEQLTSLQRAGESQRLKTESLEDQLIEMNELKSENHMISELVRNYTDLTGADVEAFKAKYVSQKQQLTSLKQENAEKDSLIEQWKSESKRQQEFRTSMREVAEQRLEEITSLRAENQKLLLNQSNWEASGRVITARDATIESLRAELEKVRGALLSISNIDNDYNPDETQWRLTRAVQIAHEALSNKGEK